MGGWAVEWSKEAPHARCARRAVERSGAAGTEQGEMWWMVVQFDGAVQQWWTRHMKSSGPEDGEGGGGGCGRGGREDVRSSDLIWRKWPICALGCTFWGRCSAIVAVVALQSSSSSSHVHSVERTSVYACSFARRRPAAAPPYHGRPSLAISLGASIPRVRSNANFLPNHIQRIIIINAQLLAERLAKTISIKGPAAGQDQPQQNKDRIYLPRIMCTLLMQRTIT